LPPRRETKDRILDAAERMFARGGFHGTSLRSITGQAGVNLAAIHYHFGSRDELIQAVFARRLAPLNRERLRLLDDLEARDGETGPDLEAIIHAFLAPVRRLAEDESSRRVVVSLLGQAITQPDEKIRRLFISQFSEVGRRFLVALARAVPHVPTEEMFWRLMFMVGAMVHTMTLSQHMEEFSGGICRSTGVSSLVTNLVPFVTAGMRAPGVGDESIGEPE
jgi:AcrR family transcriptional regulator